MAGQIQVFKSLVTSKAVFIATMKTVPNCVIEALHTLHKDFICSGKKPKISYTTLINEYSCGV